MKDCTRFLRAPGLACFNQNWLTWSHVQMGLKVCSDAYPEMLSCSVVNVQMAKSSNHFICPNNFHLVQCYHKYILLLDFSSCSVLALSLWSICVCYGSLSLLQMEVVSTFKRSGSFQGAVRRRSSVLSQLHDVTNISTPTHVVLSTANASAAPGSESPAFPVTDITHFIHRNIDTLYTETDAHISHLLTVDRVTLANTQSMFRKHSSARLLAHIHTLHLCSVYHVLYIYCFVLFLLESDYCGFCEWLFASWAV